jgi:hypothetical protein
MIFSSISKVPSNIYMFFFTAHYVISAAENEAMSL